MYRYILQKDKGKMALYGVLRIVGMLAFFATFAGAVMSIYFVMEELPVLLSAEAIATNKISAIVALVMTLLLVFGGTITMIIIGCVWGVMLEGDSVYKFITYTGQDIWAFTMVEYSSNENMHLNKVENIKETRKGQKHYIEFSFYYTIQGVPVKNPKKTTIYNIYTDKSWNEFRRMLQQLQ